MERQYWIQEQAPSGDYFDSIGLNPRTNLAEAEQQLRDWHKAFPERTIRLVLKTTEPLTVKL